MKPAALVVAASSGLRGGRIFPAVFVGVALGMLGHRLVDSVPVSLAITAAVLGVLLATTWQGRLSLFMAATTVQDLALLPVLCVAALRAWPIVTGRPEILLRAPRDTGRDVTTSQWKWPK